MAGTSSFPTNSFIWDLVSPLQILNRFLETCKNVQSTGPELDVVNSALLRSETSSTTNKCLLVTETVVEIAENLLRRLDSEENRSTLLQALSTCCALNQDVREILLERIHAGFHQGDVSFTLSERQRDPNNSIALTRALLDKQIAGSQIFSQRQSKDLFRLILEYVGEGEEELAARLKAVHLLSLSFSAFQESAGEMCASLWDCAAKASRDVRHYLMCVLTDAVLGCSCYDFIKSEEFWEVLQSGLVSADGLDRKQELFVLKRILSDTKLKEIEIKSKGGSFRLDGQVHSSNVWQDFLLVYETLEEKQIHLVQPVLPCLTKIIGSVGEVLDMSWLLVLLTRFCQHEINGIMQLGIKLCLSGDLTECLVLDHKGWKFVFGPFLDVLVHEPVFRRRLDEPSLGIVPPIAGLFTSFLQRSVSFLQNQLPDFLFSFIEALVAKEPHSSTPFVFMSHALAHLSSDGCQPVWNEPSLHSLRKLVLKTTNLSQVVQRSAIQCLLLQSILNLKSQDVTWKSLALLMGSFKRTECFYRGNQQWNQVCSWIHDTFLQEQNPDFLLLLKGEIERALSLQLDLDLVSLSRFIVLTADASKLSSESLRPLSVILEPLFNLLSTIDSRLYLPSVQADQALRLLVHFSAEIRPGVREREMAVDDDVTEVSFVTDLAACSAELLSYIQRTLLSVKKLEDLGACELCESVLQLLQTFSASPLKMNSFAENLLQGFSSPDLPTQMASLRGLAAMCGLPREKSSLDEDTFTSLIHHVENQLDESSSSVMPTGASCTVWNQLFADHTFALWSCLAMVSSERMHNPGRILRAALDALESARGKTAAKVIDVVADIIPKMTDSGEFSCCVEAVESAFRCVMEQYGDHTAFWLVLSSFVDLAYQPCLLLSESVDVQKELNRVALEMLHLSETRVGIINVAIRKCCQVWTAAANDGKPVDLAPFLDFITAAILFGPVHKKSSKSVRYDADVRAYVRSLGDDVITTKLSLFGDLRDDFYVRVYAFTLLFVLVQHHQEFSGLIWTLVQKTLAKDSNISSLRPMYHGNSMAHRLKHRIWQVLLVLTAVPFNDLQVSQFLEESFLLLTKDNQPSVRVLIEWTIARLLLSYPMMHGRLWQEIKEGSEKKVGNVSSLMNIVALVSCHIENKQLKIFFCNAAFPLVLSWSLSNNFGVRIHAQACLDKIWGHCIEHGLGDVTAKYNVIKHCVEFSGICNAVSRQKRKLLSNFIYSGFDPIADFTIEAIFFVIPRLSLVSDEEWISPESFRQGSPIQWEQNVPIQIELLESSNLLTSPSGLWVSERGSEPDIENVHRFHALKDSCDLQKKISPWDSMIDLGFNPLFGPLSNARGGEKKNSVILVASLIDKAPNLGGLCRTCEIFGVDTLVLQNGRIVDDRQFQTLSVTSEKWMNILEVRIVDLEDYLIQMKRVGYKLVGVEQTAHSKLLTSYKFSSRTLLLLGNEKEGIPAGYLNLLDDCVEIPQLGVVRSLNVHVSGALLIWEYTKQCREQTLTQS